MKIRNVEVQEGDRLKSLQGSITEAAKIDFR